MNNWFKYNERLGIHLPNMKDQWEDYSLSDQEMILDTWEKIRGKIPDRISDIETDIEIKQLALYNESNFERSCVLNSEISELASQINDLWIWYRRGEEINTKVHV